MKFSELLVLRVDCRVVARDAHNRLRTGTVAPVPRDWRTIDQGDAFTTKGPFPKVWVRFADGGPVVPWPAKDVFADIESANAAVAAHEQAGADV